MTEAGVASSSRTSRVGAGWDCEPGEFKDLLPSGRASLSWTHPALLFRARNDWLARSLGDPTNGERRRWVAGQLARHADPDFTIRDFADRPNTSFLVLADTGEGDASQYCLVPGLLQRAQGTDFMFINGDVVYPSGDAVDYEDRFYRPYKDYLGPIYAVPGNHDWYDGLNGFMRHFCDARASDKPRGAEGTGALWQRALRRVVWRHPSRTSERKIEEMKAIRARPEQQALQPGPYLAIDTGPVLLVAIDTGVLGDIDRDQGEWLRRLSGTVSKPKILLTAKPFYVEGALHPGRIEGSRETVDDIVRAPENGYIAAIGGDIHHYERYPVSLEDGRTIQYIVNGGGGAGMQGTHKIPRIDLPGVKEADFRCYPLRGDSLSRVSEMYERRLGWLFGKLAIPPDQAAALMAEHLDVPPVRPLDANVVVTPEARRAFKKVILGRRRLPGPMREYLTQFLDWNDPPMFKSFLRVDASSEEIHIRCLSATGCREHEVNPPVEDEVKASRNSDGTWRWSAPSKPGMM
ncbi:MAG: metallophosphatase family protein [Actinomycetota bacterium]|nr:metallophosphatase family protein [Actinomycetota bacterium]